MSLARATSRWSYRALHAHACGMSLPAVVVHERHRGGNSTPLDIPVADRSGPVTKIQRRIGVAVYLLPTGWTAPHALAESEVSQIATAAVMGLGGGEPAVGHHKPPSRPARFVGQGGADPAEACLVHTASERPPPHATGHRGNVEVFDDDGPVASGKAGGEDMDGLAAQVGRSPVQGRQLGFRLAVSSGSDDAARCLPGNPTALPLHSYPGRGMGDPLDAVVGMGDRRPLGADAEVDPAAAMRLAWVAGSVRDNRGHRHEEAAALLAEGHRQHPGPPLCEQPYKPPSVLLTAELADDGEGEVTPVGFQPQRAAVEPDPAAVAVAGLEPREPDRRTRSLALLGRGPGIEGGYQICDPAGVGVLGAGRPPWGDLALTLVPGL